MSVTRGLLWIWVLMCPVLFISSRLHAAGPEFVGIESELSMLFSVSIADGIPDDEWVPEQPSGPTWSTLREHTRYTGAASNEMAPVIMMAGYLDTDLSWRSGGVFKMLAWVWDPDDDVIEVEIFYAGSPTGVYLKDDGLNGDFDAGDSLYGLMVDIPDYSVEPGEYLLELRASDSLDNVSDLWPYLTIHE